MPIYEYECRACGHHLEKLQKISDPLLTDCPECGEAALVKLVSAAGFRLKGGGWYETDFKNKAQKNDSGTASASGSESGKSNTESKGNDKPAAKADKKAGGAA